MSLSVTCQTISALKKDVMYSNVRALDINSLTSLRMSVRGHYQQTWHAHTYSHICLMPFHQQHCQELSLFITAMLSRTVSEMEFRLLHFTEIEVVCRCVCVCVYLGLSFESVYISLCVCAYL